MKRTSQDRQLQPQYTETKKQKVCHTSEQENDNATACEGNYTPTVISIAATCETVSPACSTHIPTAVPVAASCESVGQTLSSKHMPLFTQILSDVPSVQVPESWYRVIPVCDNISDKKSVVFTSAVCRQVGDVMKPVHRKEVTVNEDCKVYFHVLGKLVKLAGFGDNLNSLEELSSFLAAAHKVHICEGALLSGTDMDIKQSMCHVDLLGLWRHNKCPVVIDFLLRCKRCSSVQQTLKRKFFRQTNQASSRVNLILSPRRKAKLDVWRNKYKLVHRAKNRAEQKKRMLKILLCQSANEMKQLQKESVIQKLSSLNSPENVKNTVLEILSISSQSCVTGRRYSEDWILKCLLFHIRSPSGYNFVRANNIIPLPCVRTIRRYLALIDVKCGFDEKFFKLFKDHLSCKEDYQKRGLLILDEISLRESISVCAKTLTYKGLIDFGADGPKPCTIDDKATSALVFMFQPLADKYTQPICAFASKGPVSGGVLAQLIVKAIVLLEQSGAKVHGVVSDAAASNRKFWTELGVNGSLGNTKSWFEHPCGEDRKVYVFSDTPHLIKNVRNRLLSCKILKVLYAYF